MPVKRFDIHVVAGVSRQAWSSVLVQQRVSKAVFSPAIFVNTLVQNMV